MSAKIIEFESLKDNGVFDRAIELLDQLNDEGFSDDDIKEIIVRMWLEITTEPLHLR